MDFNDELVFDVVDYFIYLIGVMFYFSLVN